jgi:hypothetical protein
MFLRPNIFAADIITIPMSRHNHILKKTGVPLSKDLS